MGLVGTESYAGTSPKVRRAHEAPEFVDLVRALSVLGHIDHERQPACLNLSFMMCTIMIAVSIILILHALWCCVLDNHPQNPCFFLFCHSMPDE